MKVSLKVLHSDACIAEVAVGGALVSGLTLDIGASGDVTIVSVGEPKTSLTCRVIGLVGKV